MLVTGKKQKHHQIKTLQILLPTQLFWSLFLSKSGMFFFENSVLSGVIERNFGNCLLEKVNERERNRSQLCHACPYLSTNSRSDRNAAHVRGLSFSIPSSNQQSHVAKNEFDNPASTSQTFPCRLC